MERSRLTGGDRDDDQAGACEAEGHEARVVWFGRGLREAVSAETRQRVSGRTT